MSRTQSNNRHGLHAEAYSSLRGRVIRFLRAHPTGSIGLCILVVVLLLVTLAGEISPFNYNRSVAAPVQAPMSAARTGERLWLGSDEIGRDVFSRLLHGGRTSLLVGFLAPLLGVSVGTVLGVASAYFGGLIDLLLQRLVDVFLVLPSLVVAMATTVTFGFTIQVVILALAVIIASNTVRIVRSQALSLRQMQYVEAAQVMGGSSWRVVFRHLVPNTLPVSIVLITVSIGSVITVEAALSFLGIGIQPPTPSWGNMLTFAQLYVENGPHIALVSGITIDIVVLAVNLVGDALRDALDPRLRGAAVREYR